ncbi:MAG: serine/threonine protein kinase, partial [Planctomycetaceae bacterium]|nr:serine/threonine protein kinase [Planctomycetaceae bacterium]
MSTAREPAAFPEIPGYRIEAVLGRGSAGVVYRAVQLAVERPVALKILHPEVAARGKAVKRLQREARTTARLAHPGIVTAIDMGQAGGLWWYAMELVDGPSLADKLKRDGPLSEREAVKLFIPLCEALEHAVDAGVVHRDIKPGNILVDSGNRARIVDLGLALAEDDPALTAQGGTLGTPHYISPEQARNPTAADVRSDIWSLGATLYHCLCGRPPFAGKSVAEILSGVLYAPVPDPQEFAPELSNNLALVLRKCLTRDPARRYQHPRELREDLERIRERRAVRNASQFARLRAARR